MNKCIVLFFIYIFLEGVLRKWIVPEVSSSALYSIKYVLLILISISYFFQRYNGLNKISTSFDNALWIYCLIVIMSAICVTLPVNGYIVGGITVVQYLSPLIIIYALPLCIRGKRQLNRFVAGGAIIALVVLCLAVVQYASPPDAYVNKYATLPYEHAHFGEEIENNVAMVGNAARVCSVFSYIAPLGDFCILIIVFSTFLLSLELDSKTKWGITALLILSLLGALMTGSRTVVILAVVDVVGISIYQWIHKRNPKLIWSVVLITSGMLIYHKLYGIEAINNFISRVNAASYDVDGRVTRLFDITRMFNYAGAFGNGVGIANNSVQPFLTRHSLVGWEEEIGRIMIEFGFYGFIAITFIRLFILLQMFKISRLIENPYLSALSLATTIVIVPMSFYVQLCLYNWFAYIVYFTMIGLNISISLINEQEKNSDISEEKT